MSGLNDTPRANRTHIAVFGKTNAGKSSIINRIAGSEAALVSNVPGTTTDPVYKSMELLPLGPVVLIDTAGIDDTTELAELRVKKTGEVVDKTDLALMVIRAGDTDTSAEQKYREIFRKKGTPVLSVYNIFKGEPGDYFAKPPADAVLVNAVSGYGIEELKKAIAQKAGADDELPLTAGLVKPGDVVVLVMPQDIQAPKGRLILPQVQVLRDLLDTGAMAVSVKTEDLTGILGELKHPPALVISDSQVFAYVDAHLDKSVPLTSFSMLMARSKGDIKAFIDGALQIRNLHPGDRVLIAESCTHHAQKGDIARDKLPRWLNEYVGGELDFTTSSGHGFPDDIGSYKLIVHCGGCMINRKNMLSKIARAEEAGVPITNFGVAIAFLNGILDRVSI